MVEVTAEQLAGALEILRFLEKKHKKYYFHEKVAILVATTGTNNLDYKNEHATRIYHIQGNVVQNDTTDYTWLGWGVLSGEILYVFDEVITPLKDAWYKTSDEQVITEGETYRARLTGCTAGDVLTMFLWGWWEEV